MSAIDRAVNALPGARVVAAYRAEDGCLVLELAHRGTDDDACMVLVEEDDIDFDDAGEAGPAAEGPTP